VITVHADHVGSLLRPPELLKAREKAAAGCIAPSEFKAIEDRAVAEAIKLQVEAGLAVITDGELRRLSFQSQFAEAVEGLGESDLDARGLGLDPPAGYRDHLTGNSGCGVRG
jgi:5-methyltetrahydropteroyltriglutamate--homocysteine methyltransferase